MHFDWEGARFSCSLNAKDPPRKQTKCRMKISIRPYKFSDYEIVTSIWLKSWQSTGIPAPVKLDDLRQRWPQELAKGWVVHVAVAEDRIVGQQNSTSVKGWAGLKNRPKRNLVIRLPDMNGDQFRAATNGKSWSLIGGQGAQSTGPAALPSRSLWAAQPGQQAQHQQQQQAGDQTAGDQFLLDRQ